VLAFGAKWNTYPRSHWFPPHLRACRAIPRPWTMSLLPFITAFSLLSWSPVAAQVLVAHQTLKPTTFTRNQARLYFTTQLERWPDGTPVKVFVLADKHPLHRAFSQDVLGLFPYQLRRVWDRHLFAGTGQVPTQVTSEVQMREAIESTPGAIGYLESLPSGGGAVGIEVR